MTSRSTTARTGGHAATAVAEESSGGGSTRHRPLVRCGACHAEIVWAASRGGYPTHCARCRRRIEVPSHHAVRCTECSQVTDRQTGESAEDVTCPHCETPLEPESVTARALKKRRHRGHHRRRNKALGLLLTVSLLVGLLVLLTLVRVLGSSVLSRLG